MKKAEKLPKIAELNPDHWTKAKQAVYLLVFQDRKLLGYPIIRDTIVETATRRALGDSTAKLDSKLYANVHVETFAAITEVFGKAILAGKEAIKGMASVKAA